MTRLSVLVLVAWLTLTGCAHFRPEPTALAFPPWPTLRFEQVGTDACLSHEDAVKLDKWAEKLQEFQGAWERERRR